MKHILMVERNGIRQVNPHFCPHEHIYPIIIDPAGSDVWKCMDCGAIIDDDFCQERETKDDILPDFDSCPEIAF